MAPVSLSGPVADRCFQAKRKRTDECRNRHTTHNRCGTFRKLVGWCAMTTPTRSRDVWVMPFKSQEFSRGPELVQKGGRVQLRLDYETRKGAYAWKTVRFAEVSVIEFTAWQSCTPEQVAAYDRFVEIEPSEWIACLSGLPDGVHHFRVFFDDIGCYDVVAKKLDVDDDADALEPSE